MSNKKIFWNDTKEKSPKINIAINKVCTEMIENREYNLIARIYTHKKGVILGNSESIEDIYKKFCEENQYEITHRPSGGSAIITEPELTLCYSIFFDIEQFGGKFNIHEIYKKITIPLAKKLGQNFSVEGTYYIRYKQKNKKTPMAGHAIKTNKKTHQFDGVINLTKFDIKKAEKILKLRELWEYKEKKYIKTEGKFYNLEGKNANIDQENGKLLRSEKKELEEIIGLKEAGITKEEFIEALKKTIEEIFGQTEYTEIFKINEEEIKKAEIEKEKNWEGKKRKNLGHCFVDLIEEEPEIHHENKK
jgi:lipoate-protein ligase A